MRFFRAHKLMFAASWLATVICHSPTAWSADFLGGMVCAECHAQQFDKWRGSHHDLAMQEASEDTVLGNFGDTTFTYEGVVTRFFRKQGGYFVLTDGADGQLAEFPVKYTFGVYPLQQYLIELAGGRLQALSIAWDTRAADQGGQKWFHLYPNDAVTHSDSLHWTAPNQNWNFMCAACHSTNLRRNYDAGSNTYDTSWSEIDVSCEACHGPGSGHVAWARSAPAGSDVDPGLEVDLSGRGAWVMNTNTGIAENDSPRSDMQVQTCARCHSRRIELSEQYEHGQPLTKNYRPQVLLEGLYYADGQILDEVYVYGSFVQSKMYKQGVICTDCHEPHTLELRAKGNALCGTCHLPDRFDTHEHHFHRRDSEAAQCVTCHMPARTYMVNDERRDHSFRVPRPDLATKTGAPDVCTDCHLGKSTQWAAAEITSRRKNTVTMPSHYGVSIQSGRLGSLDAVSRLIELADDAEQPSIARATAAGLLGRGSLNPVSLQSVAVLLRDPDPLIRVNALSALEGSDPRLRLQLVPQLLDDPELLVRIEAANLLADVPGGSLSAEQRLMFGSAIDEYVQVQMNNADRAESWTNLGNLYLRLGNPLQALSQYEHALELDPLYAPASVNLADLHRSQQDEAQAEAVLLAAVERTPEVSSLHHALGLLHVRQQRLGQALDSLKRAVELNPRNTRFRYVYAVALSSSGDRSEAILQLEQAYSMYPSDRDVLVALITFMRDDGDRDGARRYAEDLVELSPWDRNAQALLEQLTP